METKLDLAREWNNRALVALNGHYDAARHCSNLNYWLGIPSAVLSAFVGTTIYASANQSNVTFWKVLAVAFGAIAAVLTSLQTFLHLSEKAEKHRNTATLYSSISKELELLVATDLEPDKRTLDEIRVKLDAVDKDAPSIPRKIRERSRAQYRKKQWDATSGSNNVTSK